VVVVGGGITGLAAAHALAQARRAGAPIEEMVVEGSDRLGGVIQSEHVEGFVIEAGPDSFLAEKPEAVALFRELGLGDALLGSNDRERRTYILHQGRLIPLPDGLMMLVPTRLWPLVTTPLLPVRGKLALAAEWFISPPSRESDVDSDESVASFVIRHFGKAMLENVADPLLAGVYGGDSASLSVRSVLPRFYTMERQFGSLTRATLRASRERRRARREAESALPLFMTLKGGLQQAIEALVGKLEPGRIHLRQRVLAVEFDPSASPSGYRVRCEGGGAHGTDAVILALPTHECARLVAGIDTKLRDSLAAIPYSPAMTVSLAYDAAVTSKLPRGFGFLVPQKENRRLLACTFVHGKFDHRVPAGKALVRCFLGGARDPEVLRLSDDEVVALVRRELREILNLSDDPLFHRLYRWPDSMAQYVVGHAERIEAIQKQLQKHPGLYLAGNAYSGRGLSDCIRTGTAAAQEALKGSAAIC
jgi:oxygen-dependent protoporphyrinogen oxidase